MNKFTGTWLLRNNTKVHIPDNDQSIPLPPTLSPVSGCWDEEGNFIAYETNERLPEYDLMERLSERDPRQ